jgi:hypothetical protein
MMAEGFLSITVKGLTPAILNNAAWKTESLEYWVGVALKDSLGRLKGTAKLMAFDRFQNPLGELEKHFAGEVTSWSFPVISGMMYNDSAYGPRRNWGFSGMTDSLGRYFSNDPGVYFMEGALTAERDWIEKRFKTAVRKALDELSVGGTP